MQTAVAVLSAPAVLVDGHMALPVLLELIAQLAIVARMANVARCVTII
jgi:hypothetical protein